MSATEEISALETLKALAGALDLNTGATSYHLREPARRGFVQDVPERARRRERWWRAAHRDLRFPRCSEQDIALLNRCKRPEGHLPPGARTVPGSPRLA
ncbi:hypothetical protein ACQP1W_24580 [Spirillospora sp. CA-255316]